MKPQPRAENQPVVMFDTTGLGGFKFADIDTVFLLRYYDNGVDSTLYAYNKNWTGNIFYGYMFGLFDHHSQTIAYYEVKIKNQKKKYLIKDIMVRALLGGKCEDDGSTIETIRINDSFVNQFPYVIRK
jgi:hypothetical protein